MRTGTIYTSGEISSMKSWGDAFFQYGTASTKTKDELFVGYCATMGDNPIAILGVPSYNNGASYPLTARIKEVNNNSLSLAIEPWDYLNVSSLSKDETIGYLSLSAGNHKLGELDAEVSTVSSVYNVWKSVKFDKPFAVVPAVFASISSTRTSVPATVEIKNVTTDGFDVRICPEETTINGWYHRLA